MKKIVLWIILFIFTMSWVFAFNADLSVNSNTANINNPIQLTLKLTIDQNGPVKIKKINWLENFSVGLQGKFKSSSSQVTVINGQTKSVNTTIYNVVLSLSAKKAWDYTVWPAILEVWNKEYKTNTVNVKISWAKIMLNNTQNYQPQQNTQTQQVHNPVWWVRTIQQNTPQPKIQDFEKEVKKIKPQNNTKIYLFIALLIIIWIVIVVYLSQNKWKWKIGGIDENEESEEIDEVEMDYDKKELNSRNNIDFEKQVIDYPSLDDDSFESKLDNVFREKLQQNFNISNIKTKTYDEILQETGNNEKIKEIINWLKLLKYSNLVTDREKLLELVKEI